MVGMAKGNVGQYIAQRLTFGTRESQILVASPVGRPSRRIELDGTQGGQYDKY
jgi:hypothetical protein